jgi:N-acetyltransferase
VTLELQPTLTGKKVLLRPLCADDWDALYGVASDPEIWAMHPMHDRWQEAVFRKFMDDALANVPPSGGSFAIIDQASDAIIGSTRFSGYDPAERSVEIGWTFYATAFWRTGHNREVKAMMMRHIFPHVDLIYYTIGRDNLRSRAAVERLGGVCVGDFPHPNPAMTAPHVRYTLTEDQARAAGSI